MTRHERLYRRLLRVYPRGFQAEYADEMSRLFGEQLDDARSAAGPLAVTGLWVRSIVDLVATAPGVHLRREAPVPQPVDSPANGAVSSPSPAVNQGQRTLLGLLPLWILLFFLVAAPGFTEPLFAATPSVLGLPLGLIVLAVAAVVMAVGIVALRRATPTAAFVAFACLTVPAVVLVVLAPALVLVVSNMAA